MRTYNTITTYAPLVTPEEIDNDNNNNNEGKKEKRIRFFGGRGSGFIIILFYFSRKNAVGAVYSIMYVCVYTIYTHICIMYFITSQSWALQSGPNKNDR